MADFRINYDKVISQANQIDSLADDMATQLKALEDAYDASVYGWQGDAATTFRGKLNLLISSVRATKDNMYSVASKIKSIANAIQQEDERRAEEAKQLT